MTQQEYDNKKCECWEEYLSEHKTTYTRTAFDFAFDRAYALGKQAETISQEEIEKAAEEYAKDAYYPAPDYGWYESDDEQMKEVLENTFNAGANFALGKQEKDADTVIQGWVCRDKYWQKDIFPSDLFLAMEKPKRNEEWKTWTDMGAYIPLNTELFPDLTWKSAPEPVEIIIKRKKNG